jgi:hypothetical protein
MEIGSKGNWKTLQFLRNKHQIFIASLESYKPAARSKSNQGKGHPAEIRSVVHLCGKDWDDAVEALKDASERQAIMHLFASFERIIRVDRQIRGQQRGFQYHASLQKPPRIHMLLCDLINGLSAG